MSNEFDFKAARQVLKAGFLPKTGRRDALAGKLKRVCDVLASFEQDYMTDEEVKLDPVHVAEALVTRNILHHKSNEIRLLAACALADILRVYAPDPPYNKKQLLGIFDLFISQLAGVADSDSHLFPRHFHLLESLSVVRTSLVLVEFSAEDHIIRLFQTFFNTASDALNNRVDFHMMEVMSSLIEEIDTLSPALLDTIYEQLLPPKKEANPSGYRLAKELVVRIHERLEESVREFISYVIIDKKDTHSSLKKRSQQLGLITELAHLPPPILLSSMPLLQDLLENPDATERLEYVGMFCDMFTREDSDVAKKYHSLFMAFAKRFNDVESSVRLAMVSNAAELLAVHSEEVDTLLEYLGDRIEDSDEKVRKAAVDGISRAVLSGVELPSSVVARIGKRSMDTKLSVRKEALSRLCDIFQLQVASSWKRNEKLPSQGKDLLWVPNRLMHTSTVDRGMSIFVENLLDERVLGVKHSVEARTLLLSGFFAVLDDKNKLTLIDMLVKDKATMQQLMRNLLTVSGQLKEADEEDEEALTRKHRIFVNYITRKLPEVKNDAAAGYMEQLVQHKDGKVARWLKQLADPSTPYQHLRTAKKELLRVVSTHSGKSDGEKPQSGFVDYVKRLLVRLMPVSLCKESVFQMCKVVVSNLQGSTKRPLTIGALSLLKNASQHLPDMFGEFDIMKLLARLVLWEDDAEVSDVCLEIFSHCATPDFKAIAKSVSPHLRDLCTSGTKEQAEFAIRSLSKVHPRTEAEALFKDMLSDMPESLALDNAQLETVLSCVGQLAKDAPSVFHFHAETILQWITKNLLLTDTDPTTLVEGNPPPLMRSKQLSIQVLVKYLMALPAPGPIPEGEDADDARNFILSDPRQEARPIMKLLFRVLVTDGDVTGAGLVTDQEAGPLVIASAKGLLKLCSLPYFSSLVSPEQFTTLALVIHNDDLSVSVAFVNYLWKRLRENRLPVRFCTIISFAAHLHEPTVQASMAKSLAAIISRERTRNTLHVQISQNTQLPINRLPEYMLSHLVHLVAQHPDLHGAKPEEWSQEHFEYAARMLLFFVDALLANEEAHHFSLMMNILSRTTQYEDVVDPSNHTVHLLSELAQYLLKAKYQGKQWNSGRYPGDIHLPPALYRRLPKAVTHRYLPDGFSMHVPAASLRSKKRKTASPQSTRKKAATTTTTTTAVQEADESGTTTKKRKTARGGGRGRGRGKGRSLARRKKMPSESPTRTSQRRTKHVKSMNENDNDVEFENMLESFESSPVSNQRKRSQPDSESAASSSASESEASDQDDDGDDPMSPPTRRGRADPMARDDGESSDEEEEEEDDDPMSRPARTKPKPKQARARGKAPARRRVQRRR